MTERMWQERKYWSERNENNIHKVIKDSYDSNKQIVPMKNFRDMYYDCLQGSTDLKSWQTNDRLTVDDMAQLACRDVSCEVSYCTSSMGDPYEKHFKNCNQQISALNKCITKEIDNYKTQPLADTIQLHLAKVLEMKKKNRPIIVKTAPVKVEEVKVSKIKIPHYMVDEMPHHEEEHESDIDKILMFI
jgi:hypothetical protein